MAEYYLATTGDNGAAGDIDHPWLTLAYASWQVRAGDTLYIRGGTYTGAGIVAIFPYDGTAESRITVDNYQNEVVIFDGEDIYPTIACLPSLSMFPAHTQPSGILPSTTRSGSGLLTDRGRGCRAYNITGIDSREAGTSARRDDRDSRRVFMD